MDTSEDRKKLNEDLVRFIRKRSDADVPRYTARLKTYVDILQKRRRAAAARDNESTKKNLENLAFTKETKPEGGSNKGARTRAFSGAERGADELNDKCGRRRRRRSRSCSRRRRKRRSRCKRRRRRRSRCRRRRRSRRRKSRCRRRRRRSRSRCSRRKRRRRC